MVLLVMARTEIQPVWTTVERLITLDPRSPLVLDTHELSRRPGSMRSVQITVPAPADLGTIVIGIPEGSDISLDLRLEAVMEGVLVSGSVAGQAVGECGRCLDEVVEDVDFPVQELFVYPERAKAAEDAGDDEEEVRELEDDMIDLEPVLRDSVVIALPFQPLCSPDCPGLCSECGVHLADEDEHSHDVVDPRWSALQSIINETKES